MYMWPDEFLCPPVACAWSSSYATAFNLQIHTTLIMTLPLQATKVLTNNYAELYEYKQLHMYVRT